MANPSLTDAPYSQEAEEAVIGAVLINPNAFLTVASFLKADDFFFLRHSYIWQAMHRIHERREPIDLIPLTSELEAMGTLKEIGGMAYLTQLMSSTPTSVHAEVYGRLVERAAVRRRLMRAADEIKALAMDEQLSIESVTADAETKLFDVTERQLKREFMTMGDAVNEYFDRIEHLMQNQHISMGLPSGFRDLDVLLGGFQKSDLLIFAGRPGMGKCVAAGTLVATTLGLIPIEDLIPDDTPGIPDDEGGSYYPLNIGVQTPYGVRQTSHFYDSGIKPTICIKTRAGYTLAGTHQHPVLVLSKSGKKVWKTLSEIAIGDFVAVQRHERVSNKALSRETAFSVGARYASPEIIEELPAFDTKDDWDKITSVEDGGLQHCYDLTVPDGHTFVTNGIVSHNTSFLLSTAVNAARIGGRVAIFTMEMGVDQLIQRMISMETGISTQQLRLGKLSPQEYSRFVEAAGRVSRFPIFIDDTPALNPIQMRTKCRRLQHEHGIDLVIVDYMQLMNAGGQYQNNRVQEISYISRALKELARELNIPIFSAAQLSRAVEQRQDKRPVLSDLRESGSIEQDSDIVMFLYRDVVYNEATEFPNQADIIVAKHRNGPTGTISLYFEKSVTKFIDGAVRRVDLSDR